ncbi:MAG: DUF2330 domain-containing protein [Nannocystaceae bacterium]
MLARLGLSSLFLASITAATFAYSTDAAACGGFFCDGGPQGMPVDQTGENILFAFDGDTVEVHIQIAYDANTDASKFSWVIPVTALPDFQVGSELLFNNVLSGTVPFYGLNTSTEICGDDSGNAQNPNDGGFDSSGDSATGAGTSGGEGTDTGGGPTIVYAATVGAFDVVVLQGGTTDELVQWLDDNGYQQNPDAVPILDAYLKEGNLFAAFKLVPAEKPIVHPIVLRYQGVEPCVPIRLTRIASVEDMDIRVFFLGDHRAIPTNYRHVLVNPLKIDWPNFAANYKEVVTAAVDAFEAAGNAFVTEYAGPSDVISQFGLFDSGWNPKAFAGMAAVDVPAALNQQNLLYCEDYGEVYCSYNHPLLQSLLLQYLPPPMGISPDDFYNCITCYEGMIDLDAWGDGSGFSNDFTDRIYNPGERAVNLLNAKPYVTRMYTTISPHEMNEDPMFAENPDLPEIPSQRMAAKLRRCDGHAEYTLPDGREVFVPNDGDWPEFPGEMPWEEETTQMTLVGPPQVLRTNSEQIDKMLEDWNLANRPTYDTLGAADSSGTGTEGGCGCVSQPGSEGMIASMAFFGLLGAGQLRRRRRG